MANAPSHAIEAVRRFNRFYTRELGLLRKNFLGTPWSLGEMRVLFEIRHGEGLSASDVAQNLDLDAAYLSRMLSRLEKQKLISRTPSEHDARQHRLALTAAGRAAFNRANARQAAQTASMLERLSPAERTRLIDAMAAIEDLLGRGRARTAP